MQLRIAGLFLCVLPFMFPETASAHFTLVQPASAVTTDNGGKGPPPCGDGAESNIVTSVQGGHPLTLKLIETIIHPGHYRVALSVNSRAELPPDPDVATDGGGESVSAAIQNPPKAPVLADGLFVHITAIENADWQTDLIMPNINCARCTLQVIEFMGEHSANIGGGFFYHHCADLQITADLAAGPIDGRWAQPVSVSVRPLRASLKPRMSQQFTASVGGSANTTVIWNTTGGTISDAGLYTAPAVPGTYAVTATSAADSTKIVSIAVNVDPQNEKLYFAQFANGSPSGTSISTEMTFVPLVPGTAALVTIQINDDSANPINVNLNGALIPGRTDVIIPQNGTVTMRTDGQGPIQTGSVVVSSDVPLSGIFLFRGSIGLTGAADSKPLRKFAAPVPPGSAINTGIAMMGLGESQTIQMELRTSEGTLVASASMPLAARTHVSKYLNQFPWSSAVDFSNFAGKLSVTGTADLAATVILVTPAGSTSMPVAEIP